jgi:archaellum biogenesis protein FlaJ (TadC family)
MFVIADSAASAAVPLMIGSFLGAVGCLIFIMRARGFDKVEAEGQAHARRAAVRRVLIIYAVIAWLCLVVAIALGDMAFIALTGVTTVLACVGLVLVLRSTRE